ncbi:MAG TPA: helix-turn-helix domain-containing protein [Rhizomicrobium sp.]|jgi:AraC-like DNA-binding protein
MKQRILTLLLEGAISAEMLLFAVFLLTSRRRSVALYLLAGLSLDLAGMIAANLLIAADGLSWLADLVLFLDLLAPALFYLYLGQVHAEARALRPRDAMHALPAFAGLALWRSGILSSMDVFVIGCWSAYLCAAAIRFARHRDGYAPSTLRRFILGLMGALTAITLLRVVIAFDAGSGAPFLSGTAYLFVLIAVFLVTCQLLFTSLHYPNLLTSPASHIKYGRSALDAVETNNLEQRFDALFQEQKPYLNPELTLPELSAMLGVPARQISQFINSRFGTNVPAYMNQCRARHAAQLLVEQPDKPVKIVQFEAGFTSKNIFNREFQRNYGVSPTAWRTAKLREPVTG